MNPTRSPQATLNDLLDRLLDKGILLNTDLIISVAGIPLIGINLKLALAGMETMLEYGIMKDWDEAQRFVAAKKTENKMFPLNKDEHIVYSLFGTHWYSKGIYNCWRPGTIIVTNKRLLSVRTMPAETLFEAQFENITAMSLVEKDHYSGGKRQELHLLLKTAEVVALHTQDNGSLKNVLENIINTNGLNLKDNPLFPDKKEVPDNYLTPEEEITHGGNMWYLNPSETGGSQSSLWEQGYLYLTDRRLCWRHDLNHKPHWEAECTKLLHIAVKVEKCSRIPDGEKILVVLYQEDNENKTALFSCGKDDFQEWEKVIKDLVLKHSVKNDSAFCPRCGRQAARENLLQNGCPRCGWISFRKV